MRDMNQQESIVWPTRDTMEFFRGTDDDVQLEKLLIWKVGVGIPGLEN